MKLTHLILPGAALGVAALLLAPTESRAFNTLGTQLTLSLRHGRVFDNFTDVAANNNTTPDANFPGYTGAEMAIWKAMIEWGSELHGDGNGDPHQPGGLGSGGADFDASWQGNATQVGAIGHNTHSEISGGSGGVLAYCESFGAGWRIRYYSSWTWNDGPGTNINGIDLQGVACHEYGHALGLNHTNISGSTMLPSITGSGVAQRSIGPDDIAGVQFIYGPKGPTKPHIDLISGSTTLTITGSNFTATDNEVWFTQAGAGGNGTPVKVTNVTASNASLITVSVPAGAGPGDILVKNGGGNNHHNLSNAYPFDVGGAPSCSPVTYCTAKTASTGLTPQIGYTGEPKVSTANFALTNFNGGLGGVPGVYFWSDGGVAIQPFQGGFLCTQPPVLRSPAHTYDVFGFTSQPVTVQPGDVGVTRRFQFWFRDPNHPDGTSVGLSDALEVTFCN